MDKKKKILIISTITIILFAGLFFIINSLSAEQNSSHGDKIGVVVTVPPQAEFVRAVGGDKVEVSVMVPAGADPHTYEPLPSQMKLLDKSDIYLLVGSSIEFELTQLDKIKANNPQIKFYNTSQGIIFISSIEEAHEEQHSSEADPHVWVSPENAKIMVNNTYQALVDVDPKNMEYYKKNKDEYILKLDKLSKQINESLKDSNSRTILVYHPAWAYFCRDFGLEQKSIQFEGKEPSPQDISKIIDFAKQNNIKILFVSPQFNQQSSQIIAQEIGGEVIAVDPLAENYLQNMENVANAFKLN